MSPQPTRRSSWMLGDIPVVPVLIGIVMAALIGVILAWALNLSTQTEASAPPSSYDAISGNATGADNSTVPVVSEQTLGRQVRRMVDTTSPETFADFNLADCLSSINSTEKVAMLDDVLWGVEEEPAWLLVQSQHTRDQLQVEGGIVGVAIVTNECGVKPASETLLWSGEAVVGAS